MSYTQADIDKLKKSIATGAKEVRFKDHEVKFRSAAEMDSLLAKMENEVNPGKAAPRRTVAKFYR